MMESTILYGHEGVSMTHDPMRRGDRAIVEDKTQAHLG